MDDLWRVTYYGTNSDGMEWQMDCFPSQKTFEAMRLVEDAMKGQGDGDRYGKVTRVEVTLERPNVDG